MLERLLTDDIFFGIAERFPIHKITEIRIRTGKPVKVCYEGRYRDVENETGKLVAEKEDVETILSRASGNSMYAVNDLLIKSYLHFDGGIRIGIGGEAVSDGQNISAIKNISSLCIRIPHQVKGCMKNYKSVVENPDHTLIISRPGAGKTTMLRELTRLVSNRGYNCLIIDERNEISATLDGISRLDVGSSSDVLSSVPKKIAYENAVRSMNPEIIVTDEIFGTAEIDAVLDTMRCGVKVFATVHAEHPEELLRHAAYQKLSEAFRYRFFLDKVPAPGTIKSFVDAREVFP